MKGFGLKTNNSVPLLPRLTWLGVPFVSNARYRNSLHSLSPDSIGRPCKCRCQSANYAMCMIDWLETWTKSADSVWKLRKCTLLYCVHICVCVSLQFVMRHVARIFVESEILRGHWAATSGKKPTSGFAEVRGITSLPFIPRLLAGCHPKIGPGVLSEYSKPRFFSLHATKGKRSKQWLGRLEKNSSKRSTRCFSNLVAENTVLVDSMNLCSSHLKGADTCTIHKINPFDGLWRCVRSDHPSFQWNSVSFQQTPGAGSPSKSQGLTLMKALRLTQKTSDAQRPSGDLGSHWRFTSKVGIESPQFSGSSPWQGWDLTQKKKPWAGATGLSVHGDEFWISRRQIAPVVEEAVCMLQPLDVSCIEDHWHKLLKYENTTFTVTFTRSTKTFLFQSGASYWCLARYCLTVLSPDHHRKRRISNLLDIATAHAGMVFFYVFL